MNTSETKVILITGAGRRIGRMIAEYLHDQGMRVIIHCHQSETLAREFCDTLNKRRENSAAVVVADLAEFAALADMVREAVAVWGYVDALVNNASAFYPTSVGEVTESQWQNLLDTNLKAPFFLAQALAPVLTKRGGSIINISDIHAQKPLRHYPVYSISKAGIDMLTQSLAKELAPALRVNAVAPGVIYWPEGANEQQEAIQREIVSRVALKKVGNPLDIAKTVKFLLKADYITGQVIAVDGGRLLNC